MESQKYIKQWTRQIETKIYPIKHSSKIFRCFQDLRSNEGMQICQVAQSFSKECSENCNANGKIARTQSRVNI